MPFSPPLEDQNFVALISLLDELSASPDQVRSLAAEQKTEFSQSIKDAIWQKMPVLGRIKDEPGNVECYYWLGMLFHWDWIRIQLLGTFDERIKALTGTAYEAKGNPLIKGYPNIIEFFRQRYLALGGKDHEDEMRKLLRLPPPKTEYERLLEKERLIPIASKNNPVGSVEDVMALMKRRAALQEEMETALAAGKITKDQRDELTCLNRLHGLGMTDLSQVPQPLRSLFDDCSKK